MRCAKLLSEKLEASIRAAAPREAEMSPAAEIVSVSKYPGDFILHDVCVKRFRTPAAIRFTVERVRVQEYSLSDGTRKSKGNWDKVRWALNRLYFYEIKQTLENDPKYREKFVAVRNRRIIDTDSNELELVKRVITKIGNVDFFVGKLGTISEIEFSTPEFELQE